ncbi:DUF1835 domain-containing protein [Paenibacillus arenilitoris]|uniref:DUF1835 domain-containing protein n=1 Tax=Paenibacillus arenilitoris TaxID=2772299 RepID=A0A927CQU7_9BACL|nr:DUF1835 domain-containing protein [Paenibacillus arenilitoris]MBD2870576.1 DUF1835 domain-containing protein [Paenibacillus arenilitoris]
MKDERQAEPLDKWNELRSAVDALTEREAKQALKLLLLQADMAGRHDGAKADLLDSLMELRSALLKAHHGQQVQEAEPKAVHLVFGDSIAGCLRLAIKQLGRADTDKVIAFRDHFAIGPLWQLHEEAGRRERRQWLRDHINDEGHEADPEEEEAGFERLAGQLARIPSRAPIVLWSGGNAHEQVGLRYAAYLLRGRSNELCVFDAASACARRYNRADRRIDYRHAGEIVPEKLQAVFGERAETGPIDREARLALEREWLALAESREVLRLWSGDRIQSVAAHYFDDYLLETVEKLHGYKANRDFIRAARVIGEAIGYCEQYIHDDYFEYRLRELVYCGKLAIKGVPRAMRFYGVRRK